MTSGPSAIAEFLVFSAVSVHLRNGITVSLRIFTRAMLRSTQVISSAYMVQSTAVVLLQISLSVRIELSALN